MMSSASSNSQFPCRRRHRSRFCLSQSSSSRGVGGRGETKPSVARRESPPTPQLTRALGVQGARGWVAFARFALLRSQMLFPHPPTRFRGDSPRSPLSRGGRSAPHTPLNGSANTHPAQSQQPQAEQSAPSLHHPPKNPKPSAKHADQPKSHSQQQPQPHQTPDPPPTASPVSPEPDQPPCKTPKQETPEQSPPNPTSDNPHPPHDR